jgi:hypothetical protein
MGLMASLSRWFARSEPVRGEDLRYDLVIARHEEVGGFSRTIRFDRPLFSARTKSGEAKVVLAIELIEMPAGWTATARRKTNESYDYVIRAAGRGGAGSTEALAGDLYVTIRVERSRAMGSEGLPTK